MQNNRKQENLKYIENYYLHMPDEQMAQHLGLSLVNTQRLRIQNGFIRDTDSNQVVYKLHPDTLCWSCKNAVPSHTCGCSWSEWHEPVEGWVAEERYIDGIGDSWHVFRCPQFISDKRNLISKDGE